jgi:SNF2 family DNA or RNA helicase
LGQKTLVVCPSSLKWQWYSELAKFNEIDPQKIVIEGSREKRAIQWDKAKDCQFVMVSYDMMRQKTDLDQAKIYLNNRGLLIFDEIMRIKSRTSQRTKACINLRDSAALCIGLTGQPVDNNLGEFYTILNIVSPNFLPSYEKFAEMFLVRELRQGSNGRSYWQIFGEKHIDQFRQIIKPLVFRREKREVLVLPPSSTVTRTVDLSKEQKRIEKRLLELAKEDPENVLKYFTYSRENLISPSLLPVAVLDTPRGLDLWSQIEGDVSSLEYVPSKVQELLEGKITPKDIELTPRLLEVKDILEESGREKIIVFSTYVKALEIVKRCLTNEDCAMVAGSYDTEDELEKFRGDTRILLASEKAQEGLNLQFCSSMIVINSSWTFSRMEQLRGRIDRRGQLHPMTFYELNSNSVIEARINKILEKKEKLSERVLAREVMK